MCILPMVTAWGDIPDTGTVPGITATHDPSISEVPFMSSVTRSASPAMQVSTELSGETELSSVAIIWQADTAQST